MSTKKYRVVLVGCGGICGGWLSAVRDHFSDRAEIVGYVDLHAASAKKRAEEFGPASALIETSLEVALEKLKPDVVFNCTIPEAHTATCLTALEAGCHVLVEKPLAPTVAEGRQLIAASKKAGKCLAVIQNRRYIPAIITARKALAEGMIGNVHTVCADFFLAPHFGGFREEMKHVLLVDMAIHTFDEARFLIGRDATRVFCHEFNPVGSWFAHGASAMAIFELTDGVIFNYRGSWCAQGLATSWESTWRFIGDKGTMSWDGGVELAVETLDGAYDQKSFMQPMKKTMLPLLTLSPEEGGHAGNIGEFLHALDTGELPQTVATDNIRSLAMVEGAVASAEAHQPVVI